MTEPDNSALKYGCAGLGILLLGSLLIFAFGAPAPLAPAVPVAVAGPVKDSENAWRLYERAVDRVAQVNPSTDLLGADPAHLSPEGLDALKALQPALDLLEEGAARPQCQAFVTPPTAFDKLPSYVDHLRLARLAATRARQLEAEGRTGEAVELLLAAHEMGTDLLEPHAPLIAAAVSMRARGEAARALRDLLGRGGETAMDDRRIADEIRRQDSGYPDLVTVLQWETDAVERGLHDLFVTQAARTTGTNTPLDALVRFPGVRIRMYNGLIRAGRAEAPALAAAARAWDPAAMEQVLNRAASGSPPGMSWMERVLSAPLRAVIVPNYSGMVGQRYVDTAGEAALLAMASLRLYHHEKGRYPGTLPEAAEAAGIAVPTDPATGRPPGYRLEDGEPVLWFTGTDKTDDGGRAMPEEARGSLAGHDVVYALRAAEEPAAPKPGAAPAPRR